MITPKAVVFDIGKVLLEFDFLRAGQALSLLSDMPAAQIRELIDHSALLFRFETGLLTTQQFYDEVRRLTGYRGSIEEFGPAFAAIFTEITEMTALLAEFRRRLIPAYIFSNTNELAVRYMFKQYPFLSGFNGYILSYEVGAMKPNPGIYDALEKMSGLSGGDLFYLDDRPENIAAAVARGWQAHVHSDPRVTCGIARATFDWPIAT